MLIRLNLQLFAEEKTEKATPTKRRDARKKGQVAKSKEISGAVTLLFGFAFLLIGGKSILKGCYNIYQQSFQEYMLWDLTIPSTKLLFTQLLWEVTKLVAPLFGVVLLAGLIANFVQVGFMFNLGTLKMDFKKINPVNGFKNIFSINSLMEFLKSILKISILAAILFMEIWNQKSELILLSQKSIGDSVRLIGKLLIQIGLTAAGFLVILAVADFIFQKFQFEKKLRMSKQEIKDEYKKMEGDPHIKGKRRAKQRQMAMNRIIQEVPKADVVITNPTHFAIAIRYDIKTMEAPIVVAKGKDYIALKIKEIAKEHSIMTVENRPLARALYASVEVGESIPEELFNAVGEILAYVYYQEGRYKGMIT